MKSYRAGDRLPASDVPITTYLVIAGAIATRDFQPVHHDRDAARAAGTKDIFMNILTTNGLVGRYITDWAGPEARLKKLDITLGAPNFPGDCLTFTGHIDELSEDGTARVSIEGRNSSGVHVSGTAVLALDSSEVTAHA